MKVLATSKYLSEYHIFPGFIFWAVSKRKMEAERFSSEQLKSKMEAETLRFNHAPGFLSRALPAVVPVLLISIGYVDPGKWVASIEGGARFGFDLVAFTLIFNFAAIFCQYLSARVAVITGRDLAQVSTVGFIQLDTSPM